jgi:uncharacterized membrane protein YeaQ/YmgE (transglycosylase-associated protein family)
LIQSNSLNLSITFFFGGEVADTVKKKKKKKKGLIFSIALGLLSAVLTQWRPKFGGKRS